MSLSQSRIAEMLSDVEDRELEFTDWERGFVDNLKAKIENDEKVTLSQRQEESLNNLYDKYCKKPSY